MSGRADIRWPKQKSPRARNIFAVLPFTQMWLDACAWYSMADDMSSLDPLLANLAAENLALRSLLTGLLIELIRRGHIGVVSNAFAYASAPLEGLTHDIRPSGETRERATQVLRELRDELLGFREPARLAEREKCDTGTNRNNSAA